MIQPHPEFPRLAEVCSALRRDSAKSFSGIGFRFAAPKYARSKDLLSGEGAKMAGGRLNAVGTFPVVYVSADPLTATAETFQNFIAFGFDKSSIRPRVVVGIDLKLHAVLDLCDATVRLPLRITLHGLARGWWRTQESGKEALTQALGRAAHDAGFEAVMLPSVRRRGGINLGIFPANLQPQSAVQILGQDELEAHLR